MVSNQSAVSDPDRARLLVHQLWSVLELLENRSLSPTELGRSLGLGESSVEDWARGWLPLQHVEALMRLLERIPRHQRYDLLDAFLREHPNLNAPELAHEPATPDRLRALLRKARGITFIIGASVVERTWLLTALGHAYAAVEPVVGWDARPAGGLVPVPGIRYGVSTEELPAVNGRVADGSGVPTAWLPHLSNGLWLSCPAHRARLLVVARRRHVIVADAIRFEPVQLPLLFPEQAGTLDLLRLTVREPEQIDVEFSKG
jgi:hypothetical protein